MTFQGMVGAAKSIMRQAMDGEELSWRTTLIDAAVSFETAGVLDPKGVKSMGGMIKTQVGKYDPMDLGQCRRHFPKISKYMGGLGQNGNTLP
ncbi:hypothetical protein [Paenibacillus apiarius]|uniref:hypothetical protein n=1 Tax=Paenibacillus apiarius TaxID=46240 RepID=UPI003B3B6B4E